jgi:hypothetical protein
MSNIRNILLITIITATLVLGTGVIPMQSYADRGNSDDRKKDNDYKSKTSSNYESDKKSSSQHQDQDNLCYRNNETCTQANEGQLASGNDNDLTGFNDQSVNVQQSTTTATPTPTPTPTPIPLTCVECFTSLLTPNEILLFENQLGIITLCNSVSTGTVIFENNFRSFLTSIGVDPDIIDDLIDCLRDSGATFE